MLQRILIVIIFGLCFKTYGQDKNKLLLKIDNTPKAVQVDKLQAYLGKFEFSYQNKASVVRSLYKLADWINEPKLYFQDIQFDKLTSIAFDIGVDSNQTLKGAMEGDLDPAKGMFWTWQSGYINLKVEYQKEGVEKSFHIGGYKGKQNAVYRINMNIPEGKLLTGISFDLKAFMLFTASKNISSVMSPGEKAVMIANNYSSFIKPIVE